MLGFDVSDLDTQPERDAAADLLGLRAIRVHSPVQQVLAILGRRAGATGSFRDLMTAGKVAAGFPVVSGPLFLNGPLLTVIPTPGRGVFDFTPEPAALPSDPSPSAQGASSSGAPSNASLLLAIGAGAGLLWALG